MECGKRTRVSSQKALGDLTGQFQLCDILEKSQSGGGGGQEKSRGGGGGVRGVRPRCELMTDTRPSPQSA